MQSLGAAAKDEQIGVRTSVSPRCDDRDVTELLQMAGMRPTRQRLVLGHLLFCSGPRHLTVEMLYEEIISTSVSVSLATVYNTLNRFTEKGLLRQVSVDGAKKYFDTNATAHHHFYLEDSRELVDIPVPNLALQRMPEVPRGHDIERFELVVRLRRNLVRPPGAGPDCR
jgi:Fur family transcriptional regulator, iron response regulator